VLPKKHLAKEAIRPRKEAIIRLLPASVLTM